MSTENYVIHVVVVRRSKNKTEIPLIIMLLYASFIKKCQEGDSKFQWKSNLFGNHCDDERPYKKSIEHDERW